MTQRSEHWHSGIRRTVLPDRLCAVLWRVCAIVLLAGACASSDGRRPSDGANDSRDADPAAAQLEQALRDGVDEAGLTGAVAAVRSDGHTWIGSIGYPAETPFILASITKTYVAAVALRLADRGELDLDGKVELAGVPASATVRQLLNHSSGLPHDYAGHDLRTPGRFAESRASGAQAVCEPGTCFSYSDLNYIALGLVIEKQTGTPIEDHLARLFDEFGLERTWFAGGGHLPSGTLERYELEDAGDEAVPGPHFARRTWAAGGVVATAEDLLNWGVALFDGAVLADATRDAMVDPAVTFSLPCVPDVCVNGHYGLGVEDTRIRGHRAVGHQGSTGTILAHFPADDLTIAILTSVEGGGARLVAHLAEATGLDEHFNVWTSDRHGSNLRQLTDAPGINGGPAWSPDGRMIVFGTTRDGQPEIYVMDADGSNERRVTDDPADDVAARFSPDGSRIVFASNRAGNFDVWTIAVDGIDPRQLTHDPVDERLASYGRDGRIVFDVGPDGNRDIAVMNADGAGRTVFTRPGDQWHGTWSPNTDRIAYTESGAGIFTMRADGTDIRAVPGGRHGDRFPVWGPDGTLAYTSGGDIWTTRIDGTDRTRVTHTLDEDFGVWWSPDSTRLVFPSDR